MSPAVLPLWGCWTAAVLFASVAGGLRSVQQPSELAAFHSVPDADGWHRSSVRTSVARRGVLAAEQRAPRFQALDSLSSALFDEATRHVEGITLPSRAALHIAGRPPVVIFSDVCLPAEFGGPQVPTGAAATGDCKAASSVAVEELRRAIASRTALTGAGEGAGTFLCEYRSQSRFVHCVLRPLHEAPALSSRLQPVAAAATAATTHGSNATASSGLCSFALDGSGKRVVPAVSFAVGARSTATIYVACPAGPGGDGALRLDGGDGALVSAADFAAMREAASKMLGASADAACHCSVTIGGGSGNSAAESELKCKCAAPTAGKTGAAAGGGGLRGAASSALRERAARRAVTRGALFQRWRELRDGLANATEDAELLDAQLAALRSHTLAGPAVGGGQRGLSSGGVRIDAAAVSAAQALDPLARLSPPTSTASDDARAAAATGHPARAAGGIWGGGSARALAAAPDGSSSGAQDAYYRQLALVALDKVSPAYTAAAAADQAALQQLLQQFIAVTDEIDAVAPPLDSAANQERLDASKQLRLLPPVVQTHLAELRTTQQRLRRDIALVASRVDRTPNVDPLLVKSAMDAVVHNSASGAAQLRMLLSRVTGGPAAAAVSAVWADSSSSHMSGAAQAPALPPSISANAVLVAGSAAHTNGSFPLLHALPPSSTAALVTPGNSSAATALMRAALDAMYMSGTRAGLCSAWPRCLSLLGGTGLQAWLARRIHDETRNGSSNLGRALPGLSAVPAGDECADGGVSSSPVSPSPAASAGPSPVPSSGGGLSASASATRLLALRAWCDGAGPLSAVREVSGLIYNVVHAQAVAAAAAPSPSPAPAVWSDVAPVAPTPTPTTPPLALSLRPLSDIEGMQAAAAVYMSGTAVRPASPQPASPQLQAAPAAFVELSSKPHLRHELSVSQRQRHSQHTVPAALARFLAIEDPTLESSSIGGAAYGPGVAPPPTPVQPPLVQQPLSPLSGGSAAAPSYPALLQELARHADAASLLLRFNGSLACLCMFVGAPVHHLGVPYGGPSAAEAVERSQGPVPAVDVSAIFRDFPAEIAAELAAPAAVASAAPSAPAAAADAPPPLLRALVPTPLPVSSTGWFAHAADDIVTLPPLSSLEVGGWLRARVASATRKAQARRDAVKAWYSAAAQRRDPSGHAALERLAAERTQLRDELARLQGLQAAREAELLKRLSAALEAVTRAVAAAQQRLASLREKRAAALAAAGAQRDEQIKSLQSLQSMIAQLGALTAAEDAGSAARVPGCQGGGGSAGAALARKQAAALEALAVAQLSLQRASAAADAAGATAAAAASLLGGKSTGGMGDPPSPAPPANINASLVSVAAAQDAVDGAHAGVLALALTFEMATCECVAKVTGVPCATGLTNTNFSGNASHSGAPAAIVAASGNATSAALSASELSSRLTAARARLDAERRRWEEAVVRLSRPKTCAQLQALAVRAPSGVYTVFPPDDLQYRGTRVFCDMDTDGGGWTLVAHAPGALLPGPLGVSSAPGGDADPSDRSRAWNLNALWIAGASAEAALSWVAAAAPPVTSASTGQAVVGANSSSPAAAGGNASRPAVASAQPVLPGGSAPPPPPSGGITSYGAAIAFGLPSPGELTLALSPPPLPQPCLSPAAAYAPVDVRCLLPGPGAPSGVCPFPARMYTGAASLGVCTGRAYGVVALPSPAELCDGPLNLPVQQAPPPLGRGGRAVAGVMLGADPGAAASGCAGVATSSGPALIPSFAALWLR